MKKRIFILIFSLVLFMPISVSAAELLGFFDSADCNEMTGWSVDPNYLNAPNPIGIFKDGPADTGTLLGYVTANQPRTSALCQAIGGQNCSVCDSDPSQPQCAHGFIFQTPDSLKDGQTHHVYVHGIHNNWQGNSPLLQSNPKTVTCGLGDGTISKDVFGSPLTIKTALKWAGAIDSMTWKGKEFVYSAENGQQIQVALTINDWGECYNPTESGSAKDFKGPTTSSRLLSFSAHDNIIESINQMAFWFDPVVNGGFSQTCFWDKNRASGYLWAGGYPLNKFVLSDFILQKKITIGYSDLSNVIEHRITVTVPDDLKINMDNFNKSNHPNNILSTAMRYMILFNPATYITKDFYNRYWYDPKDSATKQHLTAYQPGSDLNAFRPMILTTSDEQHAIAVYNPEIPKNGYSESDNEQYPFIGYTAYDWGVSMGIGARQPVKINGPGNYNSTSYLIVGTLVDVQNTLHKLYLSFYPSANITSPTPIPAFFSGDLDKNGKVDIFDYNTMLQNFGETGTAGWITADIDNNDKVDIFDYNILVGNFGLPAGEAGK